MSWSAVWILTNEFAFRFWALWLRAFPVTLGFIANSFACWFWDLNYDHFTWQCVTQWGGLQMVTHFGQSLNSQALSGHMMLQSGFSHLTSHTAFLGSWHEVWHFGGSQTGSQIASHFGSSHFQEHSGWHF